MYCTWMPCERNHHMTMNREEKQIEHYSEGWTAFGLFSGSNRGHIQDIAGQEIPIG